MTFHAPYFIWTAVGLPLLVLGTHKRTLRAIVKPLLSFFFLFAGLHAIAIQLLSRASETVEAAPIPEFFAFSHTNMSVNYVDPKQYARDELLHILRESPAVVFPPSVGVLKMLGESSFYARTIYLGLCFAWVGDVCLLAFGTSLWFLAGLASFLIGHVCYLTAFLQNFFQIGGFSALGSTRTLIPLAVIVTVAAVVHRWLRKNGGTKLQRDSVMRNAVVAYLTVISCMMLSATYVALTNHPANQASAPGSDAGSSKDPVVLSAIQYVFNSMSTALSGFSFSKMMETSSISAQATLDAAVSSLPSELSKQAFMGAVGAFLFYLSDLFVAREKFVKSEILNQAVGLPLYYIGQIFIASSLQYAP